MSSLANYELLDVSERTQTGNGVVRAIELGRELIVTLDVQRVQGTGTTLDVSIYHSPDQLWWSLLGTSFSRHTNPGRQVKVFTGIHSYVRVEWVIGGSSPRVTFGLKATARG